MKEELIYTFVSVFGPHALLLVLKFGHAAKNANKCLNNILREPFHLFLKIYIFFSQTWAVPYQSQSSFQTILNSNNSNACQCEVRED